MDLSKREVVAIILWWAEGSKSRLDPRWKNSRSYPIELTNTNPSVIKIFVDFLRYDLKIPDEKMRAQIQIHEGDDQNELENFWSNISGIKRDHFNKTIVRPVGNKIGKSKGTFKVRFADKKIYLQLEAMLKSILKELYKNPDEELITLPHYEFTS